jgi:riboflavin biosynthesis pyrimidine reductase
MRQLHDRGMRVISAVGGRSTATLLLRERLISEIYLTTSPIEAGEPGTPFYEGPPLHLTPVVVKAGLGKDAGVRFEHLLVVPEPV